MKLRTVPVSVGKKTLNVSPGIEPIAERIVRLVKLLDTMDASLLLRAYQDFPQELIDDLSAIEKAVAQRKSVQDLLIYYRDKALPSSSMNDLALLSSNARLARQKAAALKNMK